MPIDHKRARLESRRTGVKPTWARVKASLEKMDRIGLMVLIHDLYEIDALNRRVLHELSPRTTRRSSVIVISFETQCSPILSATGRFDSAKRRRQFGNTNVRLAT